MSAEIDIKNLRFYADMSREFNWHTDIIDCRVIETTLNEIADRLTHPDMPMVLRATGRTIPDLTKREHVCEWQARIRYYSRGEELQSLATARLIDACKAALDYLWTDSDQPESILVIAQLREALNAIR